MKKEILEAQKNTVAEALAAVNTEKFLPSIQRKFVWDGTQIAKLFDSIMRGYPIGTMLYWRTSNSETRGKYQFYKFLENYDSRKPANERAVIQVENFIGVLDGQQRLTALNIGCRGSLTLKQKYLPESSPRAYLKKYLYFNTLSGQEVNEKTGMLYEFKFFDEEDEKLDESWVRVSEIFSFPSYKDARHAIYKWPFKHGDNRLARENLLKLANKLLKDKDVVISHAIAEKKMEEVLDIFIRMNSAGEPLTKGDLLFSTITCYWGEARDKLDKLLETLNANKKFKFTVEEIVVACLYLLDLQNTPSLVNLRPENLNQIKERWEKIAEALTKTVELVLKFGYTEKNLTTYNALMPIAYFIYKVGGRKINANEEKEMRKFLLVAQAKMIFGARTDQVLADLREAVTNENESGRELKVEEFKVANFRTKACRYLDFGETELENVMNLTKGPVTFAILTTLDKNLDLEAKIYHQDHVFPRVLLSEWQMKKMDGVSEETARQCDEIRNTLPNLQMLIGGRNESKNDAEFEDWIKTYEYRKNLFLIPEDEELFSETGESLGRLYERKNFLEFYARRKKMLEQRFREELEF